MQIPLENIQVINISKTSSYVQEEIIINFKKSFFYWIFSFLFGTGASILAPQSSASPGFFEYQWDPEPGYKRLKYYQSSSERNERSTYYFFLRGKERKEDIKKLTIAVPDYFEAKIKTKKIKLL